MKKANGNESSRFRGCGILDEELLLLIFNTIKWDLQLLCKTASLNRQLRAIAERVLWQQLCLNRAPKMSQALTNGVNDRVSGGWHSLAKLMFFCCGCQSSTPHFKVTQPVPGHFVRESRFSKTSGKSFLAKKCRGDVLYVSDPCEHPISKQTRDRDVDDDGDLILGIYRGVFRRFMKSKTREILIREEVGFEERMKCPYCGARVWSMTTAKLIPKSAARRLGVGSHNGGLEYFVCVNGHLHGSCWLASLSESESESESEDDQSQMGLEDESTTSSTTGEPEIQIVASIH